jgi:predicted lactoylglutathione lyase
MRQSIALVTLGVSDYARATAFYEALGWHAQVEIEETAFFETNGVVLVLWSREKLAADMGIDDRGGGWSGITLAHNVSSAAEVDEVVELARSLGAEVTREPSETFYGGYAGGFLDPDGHSWEIAHNPSFALSPDGSVVLPAR